VKRRDFLKYTGSLSAQWLALSAFPKAFADSGLPISTLQSDLGLTGTVLFPKSPLYGEKNIAFNKRTMLQPQVRVLVNSADGVQNAIAWAKKNHVAFALRSGGHSYEGFSQSNQMVIDVRNLNVLDLSADKKTIAVGAGVPLGDVYKKLAPYQLAIPAGSCFPVGVAGHTLGGGFGLLSRPFGLACDNVVSLDIIDSFGQPRTLSATENPDLFWAVRGGGNGNFGVVTKFNFRTSQVGKVAKFGMTWIVPIAKAVHVIETWQQWLAQAPKQITGTFHLGKGTNGQVNLRFAGLSVGTESALQAQLKSLQKAIGFTVTAKTTTLDFMRAATIFNGDVDGYYSIYMKAKSDYIVSGMSTQGIQTLLQALDDAPKPIAVMFDTYGGAINEIPIDATAFVHRGKTAYSIQYYMEWADAKDTNANVAVMRQVYDKMRPHVSGECYVNYCDLDLGDRYPDAYWASNLPKLQQYKQLYDPSNFFKHAQSIPL
jgi:FAD/FMN-containing dehydrogenase